MRAYARPRTSCFIITQFLRACFIAFLKFSQFTSLLLSYHLLGTTAHAAIKIKDQIAGRQAIIWRAGNESYPLIIWSHGFKGCADSSSKLSEALADSGYVVVAINHADCTQKRIRPETPWRAPRKWSADTYKNRRDDWHAVLDALPETQYKVYISNFSKIGAVGHSLGGYTVMGLAGGWDSWRRPEIKIIAALSPYSAPYASHKRVQKFAHEMILYQGGSRDRGITPGVRDEIYPDTPPFKIYVEFEDAGHLAWVDRNDSYHKSISFYLAHFFNAGLKGKEKVLLENKQQDVKILKFEF